MKKDDTSYNLQVDTLAKSLKGVLLLFADPAKRKAYVRVNEVFYIDVRIILTRDGPERPF